ncbi:7-cyano-7-deazaguanine synthase [Candidatus Woesearchaeota archaeon]|nr:7-cyano-7-deazaguanine synthase [Candidatus Woesearchaeota archaeon]
MKGLLLLSSGIDSPVAGAMMIEKGVEVIALHLRMHNSEAEDKKVVDLAKKINVKHLFFASIIQAHDAYQEKCNPRYTCIFCKKTMLRVAEKLAEKEKCDFIITGENMGQVASQTLDNMAVIIPAVKMMVLQPLLSFDKNDTVKLAKKFSTYELSIQKSPGCPYLPQHPATTSTIAKLEAEEAKIEIDRLIEESLKTIKKIALNKA